MFSVKIVQLMLYDLDAFHPVRPGSSGALYGALYRNFRNACYHDDLARLVTVASRTVDWDAADWATIFAWGKPAEVAARLTPLLDHYQREPAVQAAITANSLSVTREDGLDWLRTMLKRKPQYWGRVPTWTKRALRELKTEQGWTNKDLAKALGVPTRVSWVETWSRDIR
jgi:hypothetical protein